MLFLWMQTKHPEKLSKYSQSELLAGVEAADIKLTLKEDSQAMGLIADSISTHLSSIVQSCKTARAVKWKLYEATPPSNSFDGEDFGHQFSSPHSCHLSRVAFVWISFSHDNSRAGDREQRI